MLRWAIIFVIIALIAGVLGFEEMGYYKADVGSENAPDVNFEF